MTKTRRLRSGATRALCARLNMDAGEEILPANQEEKPLEHSEDESSQRNNDEQEERDVEGDSDDDDVHFRRKRRRTNALDTVISSEKWKTLSVLNNEAILAFQDSALKYEAQLKRPYDRSQFPQTIKSQIDLSWRTDPKWKSKGDWRDPKIIDVENFCQWLIGTLPTNVNSGIVPTNHLSSLRNIITNKKIHFDPFDSSKLRADYPDFLMYYNLGTLQLGVERLSDDQEEDLINLALDNLQVASAVPGATDYIRGRVKEVKTPTFVDFYDRLYILANEMMFTCAELRNVVYLHRGPKKDQGGKDSKNQAKPSASKAEATSSKSTVKTGVQECFTCGRQHPGACKFANHEYANHENVPYRFSTIGKRVQQELGVRRLPMDKKPDEKKGFKKGITCALCATEDTNASTTKSISTQTSITMILTLPQATRELSVLLDTGASSDYISEEISDWLIGNGVEVEDDEHVVCSGFKEVCRKCRGKIGVNLTYTTEIGIVKTLQLTPKTINTGYDLIIGTPSLVAHNLIMAYPSLFTSGNLTNELLALVRGRVELSSVTSLDLNSEPPRTASMTDILSHFVEMRLDRTEKDPKPRTAYEKEDIDEIPDRRLEAIPTELLHLHTEEYTLPTNIHGSLAFQKRIKDVLIRFRTRFRRTVGPTPAKIPAFELEVDMEKWQQSGNRTPPRRMDRTRQYAMRMQTDQLQQLNVIVPSQAAYYSHAFMVPKSNGTWRMVVDYVNLNKITTAESWPIPNIKEMIYRLGTQRPKYFAVMDMTSGYHQAPISQNSRKWTAFMTPFGIFEWQRLPMGLKGAPAYFQRILATVVLAGLINITCEQYLDDTIMPASSEDEFIERLTMILERFEKHDITVNPDKCVFGISTVTAVGHTINDQGVHFTREKLDSVLNFPKPKTQKQLKSFLGLANWFRDHIKNHSTIVQPLQDMLRDYKKRRQLIWTTDTEAIFEQIKEDIHNCPMLFFIDDNAPVHLYTDASDYGIGAYLLQEIDNIEKPIAFISKTFDQRMMNWDTPQKEGYAIFYALEKWEYLLRDRFFYLHTDHANLTQLKSKYGSSQKVQRWLKCFQGYDYTLLPIKGELNVVADTLSRLCPIESLNEEQQLCVLHGYEVPRKYWELIRKAHNSIMGHAGVERTIQRLRDKSLVWEHQRIHVKNFIKTCPCCQKMSVLKAPIHAHPFTVSSYGPMILLAIDYIESLTPDEYGNTMIVVIIDTFSRFVELYPTKGTMAECTATALLHHFGRYGTCSQILTDNGPAFVNEVIREFTRLVGTDHHFTMAYSKEENSIVERANKEVMRHLRNIIFDLRIIKSWSLYLPLVQRILNASIHQSTGVSPAQILFGNSVDLDRGIFIEYVPGENKTEKLSNWIAKMLQAQETVMKVASKNLRQRDSIHIQNYPADRTEFPINSYVLVEHRNSFIRKGPRSKLLPYRKGPMRVVNFNGSKYTLQNLVTNKNEDHHVTALSPFFHDPTTQNPLDFAVRDEGDIYVIDHIDEIQGDPKGSKKQLKLRVFWVGVEQPTWEPWSHVRATTACHTFLRDHPEASIRALLPPKYRRKENQEGEVDRG